MKRLTLVTLAICALPLAGCLTVTPEMAATGCTPQDLGGLVGMNATLPVRVWYMIPPQDQFLLTKKAEFESRCGVKPGTLSAEQWRAKLAI